MTHSDSTRLCLKHGIKFRGTDRCPLCEAEARRIATYAAERGLHVSPEIAALLRTEGKPQCAGRRQDGLRCHVHGPKGTLEPYYCTHHQHQRAIRVEHREQGFPG
jgi:hypothetical protein